MNPVTDEDFLAEKAAAIRTLAKNVVRDVIEIGRHLTEAKKAAGHGTWMPWLEREFKWSDETARKYMRLYEFAGKFQSDWNFDFSLQQLYHLTTPSTPAKARNEIFARAQAGEKHSTDLIRTVITAAKEPPAPSPCNRITALTESERPPGTMLMAQMLEIARQPNTEEEEKHSEVAATSASSDSLGQTYVRFA